MNLISINAKLSSFVKLTAISISSRRYREITFSEKFVLTRKRQASVFKFFRFNHRNQATCVLDSSEVVWTDLLAAPNKKFHEQNNGCTSVFSKPLFISWQSFAKQQRKMTRFLRRPENANDESKC